MNDGTACSALHRVSSTNPDVVCVSNSSVSSPSCLTMFSPTWAERASQRRLTSACFGFSDAADATTIGWCCVRPMTTSRHYDVGECNPMSSGTTYTRDGRNGARIHYHNRLERAVPGGAGFRLELAARMLSLRKFFALALLALCNLFMVASSMNELNVWRPRGGA